MPQKQVRGHSSATPTAILLTQPAKSSLPPLLLPTLLLLKPLQALLLLLMATLGLDQGPGTLDQGPGTSDQAPAPALAPAPAPGTKDQGPGTKDKDLATTWGCSKASLLLLYFSDTNFGFEKLENVRFLT